MFHLQSRHYIEPNLTPYGMMCKYGFEALFSVYFGVMQTAVESTPALITIVECVDFLSTKASN